MKFIKYLDEKNDVLRFIPLTSVLELRKWVLEDDLFEYKIYLTDEEVFVVTCNSDFCVAFEAWLEGIPVRDCTHEMPYVSSLFYINKYIKINE